MHCQLPHPRHRGVSATAHVICQHSSTGQLDYRRTICTHHGTIPSMFPISQYPSISPYLLSVAQCVPKMLLSAHDFVVWSEDPGSAENQIWHAQCPQGTF